jgi:RNA polymerase sigma-70 factor (ECF subfamily)
MKQNFEEIYNHYHQDIYRFVFYMVKDKQLCEDIVQDIYIKILQSYETFRGESSRKTWLFSIARHVIVDYFRSQRRMKDHISAFFNWHEKGEFIQDHLPLPDQIVIQNEEINQVYYYLDKCTVNQRSVLILRFIQSFSIQETAEILNFSISKVKTTQHRGLKVLKQYLCHNEEGRLHNEAGK